LKKSAEEITKSVQTPLQKYTEALEKLQELLKRGLISKDIFDKAQQQALQTLDNAEEKADKGTPQLLQAGSAAALEYAYNNSRGNTSLNKDQVAKEQLKAQQDANEILTQMQRDTHDMVMGNTQQFETLDLQ
jgi:mannitol-1-phosphate/altronate dehydrogenase